MQLKVKTDFSFLHKIRTRLLEFPVRTSRSIGLFLKNLRHGRPGYSITPCVLQQVGSEPEERMKGRTLRDLDDDDCPFTTDSKMQMMMACDDDHLPAVVHLLDRAYKHKNIKNRASYLMQLISEDAYDGRCGQAMFVLDDNIS